VLAGAAVGMSHLMKVLPAVELGRNRYPPKLLGHSVRFTSWSADTVRLRDYILRNQVTQPYDFATSVHATLREHAPDQLVLLEPGNTLGAICGQILLSEGWRGVRDRRGLRATGGRGCARSFDAAWSPSC
jgi:hypothetical protein